MKRLRLVVLIMLVMATGFFRTGCAPDAQAANIMLTQTSSFTIVSDLVVINISPANGSAGVGVNAPIAMDVLHGLPMVSASLAVMANGEPIAGALAETTIDGGRHLVWTPENDYPKLAEITWVLNVIVDNGL